jgi:hypothetical protein
MWMLFDYLVDVFCKLEILMPWTEFDLISWEDFVFIDSACMREIDWMHIFMIVIMINVVTVNYGVNCHC